jgi:hypothetical protein
MPIGMTITLLRYQYDTHYRNFSTSPFIAVYLAENYRRAQFAHHPHAQKKQPFYAFREPRF